MKTPYKIVEEVFEVKMPEESFISPSACLSLIFHLWLYQVSLFVIATFSHLYNIFQFCLFESRWN